MMLAWVLSTRLTVTVANGPVMPAVLPSSMV